MPYSVNYNSQLGIVEVEHCGVLSYEELARSIPQVTEMLKRQQCLRVLSDVSQVSYGLNNLDEKAVAELLGSSCPENTSVCIVFPAGEIQVKNQADHKQLLNHLSVSIHFCDDRNTAYQFLLADDTSDNAVNN